MEKRKRAVSTTTQFHDDEAKIEKEKGINKVYNYFRYTTGTSLDCMLEIGILRNCITYYIRDLEKMNLLQAVFRARDKHTRRMAKHYSANPAMWKNISDRQLNIVFDESI